MTLKLFLDNGLRFHQLSLKECKKSKLLALIHLLEKWNTVYNLTAVRDKHEMITRHLLDSLSILCFIEDHQSIADLGSGGGFPGLPLAICESKKEFTLIDSNSKKTRFLIHAKTKLYLNNVKVKNSRIEDLNYTSGFDCIVSRAFATPEKTAQKASHLVKSGGVLVLMMAHVDKSNINELENFKLKKIVPVQIFNEHCTRHVVTFEKTNNN